MKRSSLHYAVLLVAGASLTGCLAKNGPLRVPGGGSNSVVAALEGIAKEDLDRKDMQFWLNCEGIDSLEGKPTANRESVEFAGDKIKNDMVCSMEVKVSKTIGESLNWSWFGRWKDGSEAVGLMYGSNKGKVSSRSLTLTIYRLYAPKVQDEFQANLRVTFELGEAGKMPAGDKVTANLVCSETESFPGSYEKESEDRDALLSFKLSVNALKNRSCNKVVIQEENVATFNGDVDVAFEVPVVGTPLSFPTDSAKRYVLKPAEVTGPVHVGTIPDGVCLNYEGECHDRRVVALPGQKNYLVAKVMGKKGPMTVTFYVGAGEVGFGEFEGSSLDVRMINKAARSPAGSAERKAFSFYTSGIAEDLFKTKFDANFVSGKAFENYVASESDLADVMLVHIDNLRVHGMLEVSEEVLNAQTSAYWLAIVKAKKDSDEKEFIVTGSHKYFYSPTAPQTADGKPVYMLMASVLNDLASGTPQKYRAYAFKGEAMAPAACTVEKSYLGTISSKHFGMLNDIATTVDACEISASTFSSAVGSGYTFSHKLYRYGWSEIK